MSDPSDANLQLKKRARRRLVGAVAFAGLAAVVLPMVMDEEPKQRIQDVQIHIPGQEQALPAPKAGKAASVLPANESPALPAKPEPVPAPGVASGQFVILIGAFSNPANVRQLQSKIGELGVKVFTEPLETTDGKKNRVRAGPFASREAADKALDRMKKIGVNGVIAAKQ